MPMRIIHRDRGLITLKVNLLKTGFDYPRTQR